MCLFLEFLESKKKRRKSWIISWKQHKEEKFCKSNAVSDSGSLSRNDERVWRGGAMMRGFEISLPAAK
jgi:hypothetical protein